jgi:phage terminase large subunit
MIEYLPKQNEALRVLGNSHPARVVLFGGAAGGSKSFIGCAWQISRRFKYPGTRGLIGRSKLDTLKKTTLKTFFEVAQMFGLAPNEHYTINNQTHVITFANGSEIILKDLFAYPSDPEFHALGGLELTDAYVDESAQVSKRAIDILQSRIRFKLNQYDLKPKMLLTCNPSKGWLYNEFYAPFKNDSLPAHLAFIPSLPTDNPHLPESYLETLRMLPEVDRRRLLDGDWEYDESIDNLYQYDDLVRCFRDEESKGDKYISADIARLGKDRTVICVWHGLHLIEIHELRKQPITTVVTTIRQLCERHAIKLSNVVVDEDGVGGGCCDMLKCRGFLNGGRAKQPDKFTNQKAECYFKLAELIEQNKVVFKVQPFRDVIVQELDMIRRRTPEADGKLAVISKDEIARMHGKSPDYADAIMMRMYFELFPNYGSYSWA